MQNAVLAQSMRIVYLTVDVMDDIDAAGQRADAPRADVAKPQKTAVKTPRPFIPGT